MATCYLMSLIIENIVFGSSYIYNETLLYRILDTYTHIVRFYCEQAFSIHKIVSGYAGYVHNDTELIQRVV